MSYSTDKLPPERGPRAAPRKGRYGGFGGGGFGGAGADGGWDNPPGRYHPSVGKWRSPPILPPMANSNYRHPTSGWTKVRDCNRRPGSPPYAPCSPAPTQDIGYRLFGGRNPAVPACGGGAVSNIQPLGSSLAVPAGFCTLMIGTNVLCGAQRYERQDVWYWLNPAVANTSCPGSTITTQAATVPVPGGIPLTFPSQPFPDPNRQRRSPAFPPFVPPAVPGPPVLPGNLPWAKSFGRSGSKGEQPSRKEPPKPRVKERKFRSFAARLGVAFFRILDSLSESAEVVDAFYDALPPDVKSRWSKGRDKRGFIDSAGQYGIDGADWKLQALWHNWHKVDATQAVKNIVKNEVEDRVIGAYSRFLPRNTVNALNFIGPDGQRLSHEAIVAMQVKKILAALGLE